MGTALRPVLTFVAAFPLRGTTGSETSTGNSTLPFGPLAPAVECRLIVADFCFWRTACYSILLKALSSAASVSVSSHFATSL